MLMRTPGRVDYHPVLQENRLEAEVTPTSYLSKTEKDMYIYIFFFHQNVFQFNFWAIKNERLNIQNEWNGKTSIHEVNGFFTNKL